jgi:hypothetical protein
VLCGLIECVEDGVMEQCLGGYAGTGKTTLVFGRKERFPDFAVCAYTGKAVSVIRCKGVQDANTIH